MKKVLEYNTSVGVTFYIFNIEPLDEGEMSVVFTTHPEIVEDAKSEYENTDSGVPENCADIIADDINDMCEQLQQIAVDVESGRASPLYMRLKKRETHTGDY